MRYVVLPECHAPQTLAALRRGEAVDETLVIELRGSGNSVDRFVADLEAGLNQIKSKYPQTLKGKSDPAARRFEADACVAVHSGLPYDPHMLADYDWWTWLAVFRFRGLVEWRYGYPAQGAALENFGIGGKRRENLLYRLWLRADAAYDPRRRDPYELARRGHVDFWRSHIIRPDYGKCRALVRAFVTYQYPHDCEDKGRLTVKEVRELAKRLRRLHANLVFEYLKDDEAYELVGREAELAKRALKRDAEK